MNDYDNHRCRPDYDSIASIALRKIFIGGLSYGTDDDKLRKYFGVYGTVQDAVVMKDPVSRRSRGFGFITFTDIHAVDNALAHEPHTIDARKVEAKRAVPRSEVSRDSALKANGSTPASNSNSPNLRPSGGNNWSGPTSGSVSPAPSNGSNSALTQSQIQNESRHACDPRISMDEYAYNKIFVGGLHYDTRDAEFRTYFERFGRVMSAEVMFNRETHKSRGFGFIVFELERGAEQVCAEREHVIDGKVVEVKRAIPRSRITPNGTILSPSSSPLLRSSGMQNQSSRQCDKVYPMECPTGIANAKLRQDVRRSQSVGNTSMMLPQAAKPSCLSPATRRGLEASIAAIGFPSSLRHDSDSQGQQHYQQHKSSAHPAARTGGGGGGGVGSYASAVRIGATPEESESTITDQMLIGSLQSDLFEALSSNDSNSNYMYGPSDTSCIIQRPLRSLSEPVIQLPGSMIGADYFQNHIMNRMGVGALGGSFNPQSPSKFPYDVSPMPARSPVASSQASTPRSPFGLTWLSTPPSELDTVGAFPPLSLPAVTSISGTGDSTSAAQALRHSYQQGGFDTELGDYFRNHSISSQQRVQRDESIIPSPSAWASMLMTPAMSQPSNSLQRDQQFFNTQMPPQRSTQGSLGQSVEGQEQAHDFPYLYEQHHQQLQQQQLQQQLQQQRQQSQYFQHHSAYGLEKSVQNALNDDSDSPFVSQGRSRSQSQCPTPWGMYGPGSLMGSGAASRSGSLLEGAGPPSLTSGTTDRDELFLFEDSRLDIEAPEFEPQSQSQLHSQAQAALNISLTPTYRAW